MVYSVVDIFVWLNKTVHDSVSLSDSMSLSACPSQVVDGDSLPKGVKSCRMIVPQLLVWIQESTGRSYEGRQKLSEDCAGRNFELPW